LHEKTLKLYVSFILQELAVEFSIKSGSPEKQRTACVVVGVFESRKLSLPAELLDNAARGYLSELLRRGDMEDRKSVV
jgi:leucyl aminopeptidase